MKLPAPAPRSAAASSLETRLIAGEENRPATERRFLTVIADAGAARTLELTGTTVVRLLDPPLRTDLTTYLELLDANRSKGIRHLTLTDQGTGTRDLRVSFLSEVPIWKSTYRILFTDTPSSPAAQTAHQTATLQGLSVVDNTTGEDWNNVQLSLIAGSPQSFIQPLAEPIYSRRPEVPIAQNAQLTPQTHDSGTQPGEVSEQVSVNNGTGVSAGAAGGILGGLGSAPAPMASAARIAHGRNTMKQTDAAAPMIPYETAASHSIDPNTTTATFDDFFAYNLTDAVTIPRNGSALVPILQTRIECERVTLWSPSEPAALRALWITNASNLTLDRGSFSIIENGSFGGEGLLETIHPGERRLLSFAVDQAVRVSVDHRNDTHRVTSIAASRGILRATSAEVTEVEYLVHNATPAARTVIVEQPRREGWDLDSDPKPTETTPTAYRFRVITGPMETVRLHIGERHTLEQRFRLTDSSEQQLAIFLRDADASPALLHQLEPVFAAKRAVSSLDAQIAEKQNALNELIEDQKRLRDNLAALKGSAEERSLAKRYTAELNGQEDTLANLRRDMATLQQQHQAAEADLSQKINSLVVDETLG